MSSHDEAITIERLLRTLSKKNVSIINADIIELHPAFAINHILTVLYENCPLNWRNINFNICKVIDEVFCVIGNKRLNEPFNFGSINESSIIQGDTNLSYIKNLIEFMKSNYNRIMYNRIGFKYQYQY